MERDRSDLHHRLRSPVVSPERHAIKRSHQKGKCIMSIRSAVPMPMSHVVQLPQVFLKLSTSVSIDIVCSPGHTDQKLTVRPSQLARAVKKALRPKSKKDRMS